MTIRSPKDLHPALTEAFNAGRIDGLLELYAEDAVMAPQPGVTVTGLGGIREALNGFLAGNPKLEIETTKVLEGGGVAVLHSNWVIRNTGPGGEPVEVRGHGTEVVRRQWDGTWLCVIDDPFAV